MKRATRGSARAPRRGLPAFMKARAVTAIERGLDFIDHGEGEEKGTRAKPKKEKEEGKEWSGNGGNIDNNKKKEEGCRCSNEHNGFSFFEKI